MQATTIPSSVRKTTIEHTYGRILLKASGHGSVSYMPCPICGEIAEDLYSLHIERLVFRNDNNKIYAGYDSDQDFPVSFGHFDCQQKTGIEYLDEIAQVEN